MICYYLQQSGLNDESGNFIKDLLVQQIRVPNAFRIYSQLEYICACSGNYEI